MNRHDDFIEFLADIIIIIILGISIFYIWQHFGKQVGVVSIFLIIFIRIKYKEQVMFVINYLRDFFEGLRLVVAFTIVIGIIGVILFYFLRWFFN